MDLSAETVERPEESLSPDESSLVDLCKEGGSLALLSADDTFSSAAAGGERGSLSADSRKEGESDGGEGDLPSPSLRTFIDERSTSFSLI
ncbi:hypothetical protein Y032_0404g841 [Ancylostoma ceylanicum]|uniref:Uncharacterized protein n=1 Tax=Ancylostoma ceylanicum TaxID=53326 RepID=A0A016X4P6_9BILA|nr:hypothetical protein Y032_0404g841 [Ancylostoma ceylanicum]